MIIQNNYLGKGELTMQKREELTGYPSIDRPWLKYYSEEAIEAQLPEGSLYDYMCQCNKNRQDKVALNYFGRKITHKELRNKIDDCARALVASGVKAGDFVSLCLLTIPEAVYLLYAINKIGAICNFLILNAAEHDLHKQIASTDSKLIITMDMVASKIVDAAKETEVTKIVSVSLSNSMPPYLAMLLNFKNRKEKIIGDICPWDIFISCGKDTELPNIKVKTDAPAIVEYTGGTTGIPKGVLLSNQASNAFVLNHQSSNSVLYFQAGQRYLDILPPFYAYGTFSGIHMPLCLGMEDVLCPDPSPKLFPKLLKKYRPHHFSCGPLHIDNLLSYPPFQKADLSFIQTAAFGGDKVSKEWEDRATTFLKSHGSPYGLSNGYGMTETAGAFCLTTHKVRKMIPFAKNNVKIIDIDTGAELGYGQEGEICVSGPQLMLGYFKHEKETSEVMWEDNGVKWLHTGDLGYVTDDGALFISGRIKRILYSVGEDQVPYRVYPMQIESVLSSHAAVQKCSVVGRQDKKKGYLPIAFVVLTDGADNDLVLKELKELCKEDLPENSNPQEFRIVDSLPLTPVGKVDYRVLEKEVE